MTTTNLYDIAGRLQHEAANVTTGAGLLMDELSFNQGDSEDIQQALTRLYFLTETILDVGKRLDALASVAYAVHETNKAAA